jgi:hypothetical protein
MMANTAHGLFYPRDTDFIKTESSAIVSGIDAKKKSNINHGLT